MSDSKDYGPCFMCGKPGEAPGGADVPGKTTCGDCYCAIVLPKRMRAAIADAPAVGAPAKCGIALPYNSGIVCVRERDHGGEHDSQPGSTDGHAWFTSDTGRAQVDNRVGGDVPADKLVEENRRLSNRNHELLAERGELSAKLSRVMQEKTLQGDILGANAALRLDVARLEGDVSYWQREAVRLGGKNRGAR